MAAPFYVYTGPEFGLRNEAIDSIKSALKKKYGVIDEHLFYLQETPFNEVMTILQSGTLFSDGVCIVCKNAELLKKKDDIQMISDWLKDALESSVLILVSDEIALDSKIEKLVPASNRKKFWEMFEEKKLPWLYSFFQKNGYAIEEDAARLILELVENNTQSLQAECSRFFICFPKDHRITEADVDSILTHTREENAFSLFNQIASPSISPQSAFEKGLSILQKIRLSKENSSVMIIAGLSSCFRKLENWHRLMQNGPADDFTLKVNGFSGSIMQKQYRNAAKVWTKMQSAAILAQLASTDAAIRSGGSQMEDVLLQKMLYEIVIKKGASISVAEYDFC
ncbi:MAG: DNA polymerase III subunit delta [Treponema sp.]|nr:DNA polymerase III subunit delta [Treponema sp.]